MTSLFDRLLGSVVAVIVMTSLGLSFILESPFEEFCGIKGYQLGFLIIFSVPIAFLEGLAGNFSKRKIQREVSEWT